MQIMNRRDVNSINPLTNPVTYGDAVVMDNGVIYGVFSTIKGYAVRWVELDDNNNKLAWSSDVVDLPANQVTLCAYLIGLNQ